jgi:type I restriction enzyme M protein
MVTGSFKNKIDRIWEVFWTGGITNPLTVVEQITYLLFLKGLEDTQARREKEAELFGGALQNPIYDNETKHLRWSYFKELEAEQMFELFIATDGIFNFIKKLHGDNESSFSRYMKDALFQIPSPRILQKVVDMLDDVPMEDLDTKGDVYEYLLSKLSTSGKNGQFRTPRHIIDMMVELTKPTPADTVVDPACGTSGFLVAINNYLRKNHKEIFTDVKLNKHFNNDMFFGYDMDTTMLRIGAMNMMLHGVENPNIDYRDSLSEQNLDANRYSLVLANPPFKGSLDYESCAKSLLKVCKTKKTELLFLALILRSLRLGGRCGVIVPDGVLFGSSTAHKDIRKELVDNQRLQAVISMPSGVFKPYAGVSTAVLLFTKTNDGGTDKVWFYDMQNDGFSLDDKRTKLENSDISDIVKRFHNLEAETERERTEQSFCVPVDQIRENAYDLSINRYKEIVYEEVQYDKPKIILKRIKDLEKDISKDIAQLEEMIG